MSLKIAHEDLNPASEAKEVSKKDSKKESKKEQPTNLSGILAGIHKEKGEKVIVRANAIPPVRRLPTGMFEFDFHLGGGFPCGRYSIVYGPESSGKTNIALKAIAQAQRLKDHPNKAVLVNLEQSFDPYWAEQLGVNTEDLLVVNPAYGEEAVDIIDAIVRADDLGILVVDSLAALVPNKEIAKSTEDVDMGTASLLTKRLVNKLMVAFGEQAKKGCDPCVIMINQTRFKLGVMFGDPETMPGGEAQKFLASLRIRTYGKNVIDKATNMTFFKDIKVVVKKAKVPVRAMDFSFNMCVHPHDALGVGDTESFNSVKTYLQGLDFLKKEGKGYKVKGYAKVYDTIADIAAEYYKNKDFALQLQGMVNDAMNEMILVEEQGNGPANVQSGNAIGGVA